MIVLRRVTWALCVSALISSVVPTAAQDVGGIINMMGRIIEQDMRRQEHRQRRQAEDQAVRQRQRAAAAEQRARQNEIRRKEIQYVRRLQAAMARLGFYDMVVDGDRGPGTRRAEASFIAAYELAPVVLEEGYISHVEYLAQLGFRSARELADAAALGFETREELVAAREGGFDNAQDLAIARQQGFNRYDDYRKFRASGFESAEDFRLARDGGFTDRHEFEEALAAGFADHSDYVEFRQSGLPDKASFVEYRAELALAVGAADICSEAAPGAEIEDAVAKCLSALAHPHQRNLLSELEHLDRRISDALDALARQTPSVEVAAEGSDAELTVDSASFLQTQAALKGARSKLGCGIAVARHDWASASSDCAVTAQAGDHNMLRLASRAADEFKAQQDQAAEEERTAREAAEAERGRLALSAGKQRLASLLSSIADFTESKRTFTNAIDVARAVVRLRQLEASDDVKQIEQAILNVDELLKSEDSYQTFIEEQKTAVEISRINARATAAAELRRTEAFIADFVGANILHEAVNDLLELQELIAKSVSSGQDEALFNAQRLAANAVDRLKLRAELDGFVYSEVSSETAVEQADNGLAITDANQSLLTGDPRDVIILGNYSPNAPHLIVNLVGLTTFENGTANLCWIGPDSQNLPLGDYVTPILRKLGAQQISASGLCNARNALKQDVLVIERGTLLSNDLLEVQPIISAFEAGTFKAIDLVSWSSVGQTVEADAQMSMQIKDEVTAGVRQGFGFVSLDNADTTLCTVVPPADAADHENAFELAGTAIERHVPANMSRLVVTLDRAFSNIQRNSCRIVYAQADDLARLLAALAQINKNGLVLPVWITPELVEEGAALSASSVQERERRIALRRQEMEAAARFNEENNRQAEVARRRTENQLRSRYSQEARAAHNDLSELSKAFLSSGTASDTDFAGLFPETGKWRAAQAVNGWIADEYHDELVDYGTAEWKARRLEAVLMRATLVTKNAQRGEYSELCVIIGYLIDREFGMRRDAVEAPCEAADDLSQWKRARLFESRWIAH